MNRSRPRRILAAALTGTLAAVGLAALHPTPALAAAQAEVSPFPAQTIDDIGASGAWWVNDLVHFSPSVQQQVANLLFSSSGIQLSAYRYNIGGGGVGVTDPVRVAQTFQVSPGVYDWTRDPGGRAFLGYAASAGVPDLIGFVNSAPPTWTSNAKSCGGTFTASGASAYATYLADVVAHFAAQGVTLDYVSPMNEPTNSFSGCGQEGMLVSTGDRAPMINAAAGAFSSRSLSAKVIADESSAVSTFNTQAPTWLGVAGTPANTAALAHHTYDDPNDATMIGALNVGRSYAKKTWATEICCFNGIGTGWGQQYDPTITSGLAIADIVYKDFAITGDSAFHWWVALASGLGCDPTASSTCATSVNSSGWNDGLIYYDPNYASNGNQSLYLTKRFYALGQYSKFVRPGAVRYAINDAPSGVQALAFNANGQWTVVATNLNSSATAFNAHFNVNVPTSAVSATRTSASESLSSVSLPSVGSGTVSATLAARSVTTFVLNQSTSAATSVGGTLLGKQSAKCLTAPSTTNGVQLTISACTGASGQSVSYTSGQQLQISGKCVEAYQQGTGNGTIVDLYTCNGGANQRWRYLSDGVLLGEQSGKCLDVTGQSTANGALVELWSCNGGSNQLWYRP